MALVVLTSLLNSPPPPISSPLSALLFVFGPADVRLTRFKCTYSSLPQTITTSYTQIAACSGTKHMRIPRIERHGTDSLQNHCIHSICVCTVLFSAMNNKKRLQYNPSWCLLCFVELCALNERTLLFRREICASVLCGCYQLIWISVVQIEHYWPIAIAIACCVFVFRLRLHKLLLTPVQLCFPSCNWR